MVEDELKTPPGVVATLLYPDGGEVASVADFNLAGYGGCTLEEAQTMRAKRTLSIKVIGAMCSPHVACVMDIHRCDEVVDAMISKSGFRRVIVPVGHGNITGKQFPRSTGPQGL